MNTLAKSTNSRSMRYTCLDVRSPDVNFLRKVMSSSRHDGCLQSTSMSTSADADIVSAFPLSFSTFLENINILRQTSSTWHRILREFCVLKNFQKPVTLPRAISFIKRYLFYYIYENSLNTFLFFINPLFKPFTAYFFVKPSKIAD